MPNVTTDRYAVTSSDGTTIVCHVTGKGPPLLFIHGTGANSTRWSQLVPDLARDFTVYAMDRRGRGESGDTEPYALEREAEDVAVVCDDIPDPVDVVAHSFGALCALEATRLTKNLRKVILYEPPVPAGLEIYAEDLPARMEAILEAEGPEALLVAFFREVVEVTDEELDVLRNHPAWPERIRTAPTIPRELRAALGYRLVPVRFAGMRVPVMVMMGSGSPPYMTAGAKSVRMSLPRGTLAVLDNQQHVAMDTDPDLFLSTVRHFLG
jgi:pimeloyl-ACP methyl ester carboxylesterase